MDGIFQEWAPLILDSWFGTTVARLTTAQAFFVYCSIGCLIQIFVYHPGKYQRLPAFATVALIVKSQTELFAKAIVLKTSIKAILIIAFGMQVSISLDECIAIFFGGMLLLSMMNGKEVSFLNHLQVLMELAEDGRTAEGFTLEDFAEMRKKRAAYEEAKHLERDGSTSTDTHLSTPPTTTDGQSKP